MGLLGDMPPFWIVYVRGQESGGAVWNSGGGGGSFRGPESIQWHSFYCSLFNACVWNQKFRKLANWVPSKCRYPFYIILDCWFFFLLQSLPNRQCRMGHVHLDNSKHLSWGSSVVHIIQKWVGLANINGTFMESNCNFIDCKWQWHIACLLEAHTKKTLTIPGFW